MKKEDPNLLTKAAKAIGGVAGTVAATAGVAGEAPTGEAEAPKRTLSTKVSGKFPKKDKSRLPRKEKKMRQKEAVAKAAKAAR